MVIYFALQKHIFGREIYHGENSLSKHHKYFQKYFLLNNYFFLLVKISRDIRFRPGYVFCKSAVRHWWWGWRVGAVGSGDFHNQTLDGWIWTMAPSLTVPLFKSMHVGKSDPLDLLTIRCNLDARDFTSRLVHRLLIPIVQDLLLLPMSRRFILSGSFS